jgi:hypothetical protein
MPYAEYSCLSISREDFRKIYKDLPILEHEELFYSQAENRQQLVDEYLTSKLWRLNNIYTIVDKWGDRMIFKMNRAQHLVYAASLRHPRLVILKSRQQGISTFWLVSFFDDCCTQKDLSIGLMAQGQDEAEALLERTKLLWDTLDGEIKTFLGLRLLVDNTKEFKLSSNSKIFIRTSFRSTTLQRLHISEMGKIANAAPKKANEVKTGSLQALAQGNIGVVESTAEGDNLFKDMWDNAVLYLQNMSKKDFMPVFLSWIDDPDCNVEEDQVITPANAKYFKKIEDNLGIRLTRTQKNFWIVQYRELSERVYQEYPATALEAFMATKKGSYYADLYMEHIIGNNREIKNIYDKNLYTQCAFDLGMNDTMVCLPFQCYTDDEFRIIDEFYDNGQQIKYYTDWMKEQPWWETLNHVILPHDGAVTSLNDGKTREDIFREELKTNKDGTPKEIKVHITVLEKTASVNTDIELVRIALHNLYLDIKCEFIKKCILGYKKEWDDRRERWRDKPDHSGDDSHGADAVRYMVMGANRGSTLRAPTKRPTSTKEYGRTRHRQGGRGHDI